MARSRGATVRTCRKILTQLANSQEYIHVSTLREAAGVNTGSLHAALDFLEENNLVTCLHVGKNAKIVRIGGALEQ